MKVFFFTICLVLSIKSIAQDVDSTKAFTISAYGEVYYSYDFSQPANHTKPDFVYNHKRHNELNLNLCLIQGAYQTKKVRGNLGLMAGNYAQYNMSAEPTWAQFIYEANAGVCISQKNNVWIDAGVFSSHYGFESLLQTESWTLTRGMYVENVPYYISGVAISAQNKKKTLFFGAILLNGWQHIQRPDGYQKPSLGLQATYKPNDKFTLNYCNFLGSDKPDSLNSFRHFHNLYAQLQANKKLAFIAETNMGFEKPDIQPLSNWYSLAFLMKYQLTQKLYITLREEYYNDSKNIIVPTNFPSGFKAFSSSANVGYWIQKNAIFKLECKYINSPDKLFKVNSMNDDWVLTTSLAIKI